MTVFSYERGSKKVIFDSDGVLASGADALNSLGDELWFMPFKGQSELPEKLTWEVLSSGTVTTGGLDLEGTLGQEEGFSGPSVHGDKAASGLAWQQIDLDAGPLNANVLRHVTDKKVRAVRVKVTTIIAGGGRLIVAVST